MIVAKPPPWAQTVIFAILAPIARARGLKPTYPEYPTSEVIVGPDPEALSRLDANGRLRAFG